MAFGTGFQWRESRRVLYLREDCIFKVQEYDANAKTFRVCMDDGFNRVFYAFEVKDCGTSSCCVIYSVDCRHIREGLNHVCASQPSERLARMMAKQDGELVKRLKAHIESQSAVRCF